MKILTWLILALTAAPAMAVDLSIGGAPVQFTGHVGIGTDYQFRGIDLLESGPAAEAEVEAGYRGAYLGLRANRVDVSSKKFSGVSGQFDIAAGYRLPFEGFLIDLGATQHVFSGQDSDLDFYEMRAGVSRSWAVAEHNLGAAVRFAWTPDYAGKRDAALYSELALLGEVQPGITATAGLGQQHFFDGQDAHDYRTWNAGLTFALTSWLEGDVRYIDGDADRSPVWKFGKPMADAVMASVRAKY